MGVCKNQDSWRVKYPWAVAVPSDVYKARCKYCPGKLIDVKCGAQALARHEGSSMHSAGAASVSIQPHFLVESVKNANKRYKEETEQNRLTNEIATEEATNLRAEVLVFKRRTNKKLLKELKRVQDEVDEAESA